MVPKPRTCNLFTITYIDSKSDDLFCTNKVKERSLDMKRSRFGKFTPAFIYFPKMWHLLILKSSILLGKNSKRHKIYYLKSS